MVPDRSLAHARLTAHDPRLRLHAILDVDVAAAAGWSPSMLAQAFLDGGAALIQLRAKQLDSRRLLTLSDELVTLARPRGARIIVNDRADLARLAGADGVHLGQDDLPPAYARTLLGEAAIIGYSTHTIEQVESAREEPIDYVAVGPTFGTSTKHTGYEAVGLALVRDAAGRVNGRPVVAIGGITLGTAWSVIEAGASAVAVISDLLSDGNPRERVAAYLHEMRQV